MPFQREQQVADDVVKMFGEYLTTFISKEGQVRADLFRRGRVVEAYVSFPSGMDATNVTDPYYGELWAYAREQGFADHFKVIYT